jgi:hypothetical protein
MLVIIIGHLHPRASEGLHRSGPDGGGDGLSSLSIVTFLWAHLSHVPRADSSSPRLIIIMSTAIPEPRTAYIVLAEMGEGDVFACSTKELAEAKAKETVGMIWPEESSGFRRGPPKAFPVSGSEVSEPHKTVGRSSLLVGWRGMRVTAGQDYPRLRGPA